MVGLAVASGNTADSLGVVLEGRGNPYPPPSRMGGSPGVFVVPEHIAAVMVVLQKMYFFSHRKVCGIQA